MTQFGVRVDCTAASSLAASPVVPDENSLYIYIDIASREVVDQNCLTVYQLICRR
jgi:hypothetical protein